MLDDIEAEEHAKLLWDDGLIAKAFKYSRCQRDFINPGRSLFDFLAEKAEDIFADEPAKVAYRKRQTLLLVARMWGSYIGSPVEKQSLRYFWLEECIDDATTANLAAHQPPPGETDPHYPGFTHWLAPAYAPDTNPERWNQEGMNLVTLPPSCAHPTLLFYIYGPCSKYIAGIVTEAESESERDAQLLDFFRPYYSLLPNYDHDDPRCQPKAVLATAWANDEFAGYGSYCNFQVGLENGDSDIEVMRHGMPERHVWFAGEHTAPFAALGTTTGAYISGERVAARILKAHGLKEDRR
ncbi:hypothetical protein LTR37_002386 [Vermiconidia calcicola]|uniref:Uncharacterized protein n=1 Tax=Vermiconidia calcicola TaxID=1690605 RepID=A0ACC3NSK2_9PEZI|nr:hypothetical protein LTR37_002386 [Vermiconidia calcicola]